MADKSLFIDIPWTSQPQGAVEIDWANPLTRALRIALSGSLARSILDSKPLTVIGTPDLVATQKGLSYSLQGGSGLYFPSSEDVDLPVRHSISAWILIKSIPTHHFILDKGTNGVNWSAYTFGIGSSMSTDQQKFSYMIRSANSASPQFIVMQPDYITTNGWYHVVATHDGVTLSLYINGVLISTAAGSSSAPYTNTSRLFIGGEYNNTPTYINRGFNYPFQDLYVHARCISASEVKSLYDSPWQIFKPRRVPINFAPRALWSMRESRMRGITDLVTTTVQEPAFTRPQPLVVSKQPQTICAVSEGWIAYNAGAMCITGFGDTVRTPDAAAASSKAGRLAVASTILFPKLNRMSIAENVNSVFTLVASFTRLDSGAYVCSFSNGSYGLGINTISSVFVSAYGTWYGYQSINPMSIPIGGTINVAVSLQWSSKATYNFYTQRIFVNGAFFTSTIGAGYPAPFDRFIASSNVSMAAIRAEKLDDAQLLALSLNPWQIFKANKTPLFYPSTRYKDVPRYTPPSLASEAAKSSRIVTLPKYVLSRQPQGPVGIDWANPLTKGLIAALLPSHPNSGVVFASKPATPAFGARTKAITQDGYVYKISYDDSATGSWCSSSSLAALTMVSVVLPTATNTADGNVMLGRNSGGSSPCIINVGADNIPYAFHTPAGTLVGLYPLAIGELRTLALTVTHRVEQSFYDRGDLATRLNVTTNGSLVDSGFWLLPGYASAVPYVAGGVCLQLGFARVLSGAEIKSLSDNPWQIFKSPSSPIFGGIE